MIDTLYGTIGPVRFVERDPEGRVLSAVPCGAFSVSTPLGALVPQHTTDDMRRPKAEPLLFHPGGRIRTIALERRTPVPTPLGDVSAELLTFHPDGALHRVFPLNGKLSGYWSVEEESKLADPLTLETPAGSVTAKILSLRFFEDQRLHGVTLWPGETVQIATPLGPRKARIAFTFHPGGQLASMEPADVQEVTTPLGPMLAFDPDAEGVHGDLNSLRFTPEGRVCALATTMHTVTVTAPGAGAITFSPPLAASLCDENVDEARALKLAFADGLAYIGPGRTAFDLAANTFEVKRFHQGGFTLGALTRPACG